MLKIRRAMTLIAIFLAIGSIVPVVTSTPAAAATPLLGAYVGGGNVQAASFEADTGTELTLVSDYLPAGSWANISDPTWITRTWAGTGHRLALSVPMLPSGATPSVGLAAGASGNYNSYFLTLAQRLVSGGLGNTILRLGWEFTGNWFPWAATNATLAGEYAEYFRQIVTVMQTVPGQQFQFDWNPTPGPQPYDLTLAYPGDQYVDYVSMDVYDQSWSPNHTPQSTWRSIETNGYGLDWLASFAAQHNKEMALPEWGISVYPGGYGNGDDPYFIQQLSSWINSNNVGYFSYFNFNASGQEHQITDGDFPNSLMAYKNAFGGNSSPNAPGRTGSGSAGNANPTSAGTNSAGSQTSSLHGMGMASTPDGGGYWEVAADGGIFSFGDARFHGSMGGTHMNQSIVGMASTPDGGGYWEVAADGGIFSFGDARFHGSMGGTHMNQPIVGMASTPDGGGYWEVAADGGIFSFGDARFHGSMGGTHMNQPIVGMASTPDGGGYWEVAADGGIFSFGDARFHGSMGGTHMNQPIVGMASTPDGGGYWEVAADGGIFSFGDARFHGSMGGLKLNEPVVGMDSTPDGLGYWLVAADGGVSSLGDAPFYGSMG